MNRNKPNPLLEQIINQATAALCADKAVKAQIKKIVETRHHELTELKNAIAESEEEGVHYTFSNHLPDVEEETKKIIDDFVWIALGAVSNWMGLREDLASPKNTLEKIKEEDIQTMLRHMGRKFLEAFNLPKTSTLRNPIVGNPTNEEKGLNLMKGLQSFGHRNEWVKKNKNPHVWKYSLIKNQRKKILQKTLTTVLSTLRNKNVPKKKDIKQLRKPINIVITGATGNIARMIENTIAHGIFDRPVNLYLESTARSKKTLHGIAHYLRTYQNHLSSNIKSVHVLPSPSYPSYSSRSDVPNYRGYLKTKTKRAKAFKKADLIIAVGGKPIAPGKTREDVLLDNLETYAELGEDIQKYCPKSTKVIVVANPANALAEIVTAFAPKMPWGHITSLGELDRMRLVSEVSELLGVDANRIKATSLFNHSNTMGLKIISIEGLPPEKWLVKNGYHPDYLKERLYPHWKSKDGKLIDRRRRHGDIGERVVGYAKMLKSLLGKPPTMGASYATGNHALAFVQGTGEDDFLTMGVPNEENLISCAAVNVLPNENGEMIPRLNNEASEVPPELKEIEEESMQEMRDLRNQSRAGLRVINQRLQKRRKEGFQVRPDFEIPPIPEYPRTFPCIEAEVFAANPSITRFSDYHGVRARKAA